MKYKTDKGRAKEPSAARRLVEALRAKGRVSPPRARALLRAGDTEASIQAACLRWFRTAHPALWKDGLLFHIPNEGRRGPGVAARDGIIRGVADLCLAVPRRGYGALYIEMKKPEPCKTYQSPAQKAWGVACERAGNCYRVVRSLAEFELLVGQYLGEGGRP